MLFKENAYALMPNEVTVSLPDCGIKAQLLESSLSNEVTDSLLDVTK